LRKPSTLISLQVKPQPETNNNAMNEHRICEECQHPNAVHESLCTRCGADLSFVMISEAGEHETAPPDPAPVDPAPPSPAQPVKICEVCGTHNAIDEMECTHCQADIAYIRPQMLSAPPPPVTPTPAPPTHQGSGRATMVMQHLVLVAIADGQSIEIPPQGGSVGREGLGAAYLDRSDFVSRQHIRLDYQNATWMMTVLGTNPTLVNDRRIAQGDSCPIEVGDVLHLADLEFRVRLA
jgi:hypothetical protein